MNSVTASFNTIAVQMTEMSQKKWPKCLNEKKQFVIKSLHSALA